MTPSGIERVVQLRPVPSEHDAPAAPAVNDAAVSMLEKLLEDARSGRVNQVAFCSTYNDTDDVTTGYSTNEDDVFRLLGAIERLKLRFYQRQCTTNFEE